MFLGILTVALGIIAIEVLISATISGHDEFISVCGDAFERKNN